MLLLQTFYEFFHFIERSFSTKTESEICLMELMDSHVSRRTAYFFSSAPKNFSDLTGRTTEYVHTLFGNAILKFRFLYISFCYKHQPMQQAERMIVILFYHESRFENLSSFWMLCHCKQEYTHDMNRGIKLVLVLLIYLIYNSPLKSNLFHNGSPVFLKIVYHT